MAKSSWRLLVPKIGQLVSAYEKILLALLSVVIVISGSVWFKQVTASQGGPTVGGSYVEGIVSSQTTLEQIAVHLTKTGLLSINDQGKLENQLVSDWQANSEKTQYTFTLINEVDRSEIISELQNLGELLGPMEVSEAEERKVIINLAEPNPNLPVLLSQPLFDYGAYKLSKATDKTTIFTRNTKEGSEGAYINKIIIHSYPDEESLKQAISKRKLDGALISRQFSPPRDYAFHSVLLPRYYAVLFNVNKTPFRDAPYRQALASDQPIPSTPFVLTVPDKEPYKSLASEITKKWQARGAQITVEYKPLEEVREKITPTRNFQALLTGLDYGAELDPYYIWHSSQIRPPGNNLTGIKSEEIDTIITNIRSTYDIPTRAQLITSLHERVGQEGIAVILEQESFDLLLSNHLRFSRPWLATTDYDHFQAVSQWSVR